MIAFSILGLDSNLSWIILFAALITMIYYLVNGFRFVPKKNIDGVIIHKPKNTYLQHNGFPRKVIWYEEIELKCINKELGIYDAESVALLENGEQVPINLRNLQPAAWETIDGGMRDKRIWQFRSLMSEDKQREYLLEELKEVEVHLQTMTEAARKTRQIPEQWEQDVAEHIKNIRTQISPPPQMYPSRKGLVQIGENTGENQ